ncbi:hypothetical protein KPL71_023836 [Citrus sinensis]|uniref:Uncharacterized protein n=1 Tax=Citrus sinensis TaxID=2711 RepID=A0ACB8IM05_CITSI|nr:hypothetical protein KPL71_023836 [Citrus sinensis]
MLGHSRSNSMSDDEEQSVQMEGTHRGKEKAKRKRPPMKKRSEFVMPSRRSIGRDVMELFLEEKAMLKSLICNNKQRVSLTTDLWTYVQNMSYMDWGIERLFALIVDNATANDIAVGYVTMQLLTWRNDDALVLAGQYIHVCCYAHILNLIVVSRLGELHASVTAIRNAVKFVRSSSTSYGGASPSQRFTTEANLVDVTGGECDDPFQVARSFLGYARKVFVHNESRRVVFEVERYLKDPVEDPNNLKLMLWWRVNGSRYPILEKIARDVLVVPVSTVTYESAFSIGHRIIDEYRSSLTPAMVEALICTEIWLQSKLFANPVYNLQEDIKEQMFHMELQEELIRSQASTMEAVSAEIGVMDV